MEKRTWGLSVPELKRHTAEANSSFTALHATAMLSKAEDFILEKVWKKLILIASADCSRQGTKDLSTLQLADKLERLPVATTFCLEHFFSFFLVMPLYLNYKNKPKITVQQEGIWTRGTPEAPMWSFISMTMFTLFHHCFGRGGGCALGRKGVTHQSCCWMSVAISSLPTTARHFNWKRRQTATRQK